MINKKKWKKKCLSAQNYRRKYPYNQKIIIDMWKCIHVTSLGAKKNQINNTLRQEWHYLYQKINNIYSMNTIQHTYMLFQHDSDMLPTSCKCFILFLSTFISLLLLIELKYNFIDHKVVPSRYL